MALAAVLALGMLSACGTEEVEGGTPRAEGDAPTQDDGDDGREEFVASDEPPTLLEP